MTTWQAIGVCTGLLVGAIILYWRSMVAKYGEKQGEIHAMHSELATVISDAKATREATARIESYHIAGIVG